MTGCLLVATITPATLDATTNDIARLQGQLRQTHLKYHLAMVDLLSPEQIQRYRQLRGYEPPPAGGLAGITSRTTDSCSRSCTTLINHSVSIDKILSA